MRGIDGRCRIRGCFQISGNVADFICGQTRGIVGRHQRCGVDLEILEFSAVEGAVGAAGIDDLDRESVLRFAGTFIDLAIGGCSCDSGATDIAASPTAATTATASRSSGSRVGIRDCGLDLFNSESGRCQVGPDRHTAAIELMTSEARAFGFENELAVGDIAACGSPSRSSYRGGSGIQCAHIGNNLPDLIRTQPRKRRHRSITHAIADIQKDLAVSATPLKCGNSSRVTTLALCSVDRLARRNSGSLPAERILQSFRPVGLRRQPVSEQKSGSQQTSR